MRVLHGLEALELPLERSVLIVGNFDGVHRAHQQLLSQAVIIGRSTGAPVVVLTFEPHPLTVVAPAKAPPRLSTLEEKLHHLSGAGVEIVVVARSEAALLHLEAERFVEDVIVRRFHPTHVVEGPSFGFGRGRRGGPELLRQLGDRCGFEVHIVEPVTIRLGEDEARMVSSSLIRRLLSEGKVEHAAQCLGRLHLLIGKVIEGDRRGRDLGFPTANVAVADQLVPAPGVYGGRAMVRNDTYLAAISIGNTPTFDGTEQRIEAHLLDFHGNLYGESIRLEFERHLRVQRAFESPGALAEQLRRDVEMVRCGAAQSSALGAAGTPNGQARSGSGAHGGGVRVS